MDIEIRQGNTFTMNVSVRSEDVAYDITGKVLVFSSDVLSAFHKSTADGSSGFVVTNAAQGEATLTIPANVTRTFEAGSDYRYEIELWDEETEVNLVNGSLTVLKGINSDQ